jgi:hypothetical protein
MAKIFKEAVEEVAGLPEADQETIGRRLLSHVEKLRRLRVEIDIGMRSLDAGAGEEPDIEEFIPNKASMAEPRLPVTWSCTRPV